jgi:hypothetical protein
VDGAYQIPRLPGRVHDPPSVAMIDPSDMP